MNRSRDASFDHPTSHYRDLSTPHLPTSELLSKIPVTPHGCLYISSLYRKPNKLQDMVVVETQDTKPKVVEKGRRKLFQQVLVKVYKGNLFHVGMHALALMGRQHTTPVLIGRLGRRMYEGDDEASVEGSEKSDENMYHHKKDVCPLVQYLDAVEVYHELSMNEAEGAEDPTFLSVCEDLYGRHKVSLYALFEPRMSGGKASVVLRRLGFSKHVRAVFGDFNAYIDASDKVGGVGPNLTSIRQFNECILKCGLLDMGFKEPKYTWSWRDIKERIDKGLCNNLQHHVVGFFKSIHSNMEVLDRWELAGNFLKLHSKAFDFIQAILSE
ncbi:hypothetical protein VNO78_17825 [Psophocarpus tetragonolobus]|uniref:Uncharacterized protein n=1 Tax=Psophocarpus tetragonolobus TaxID=3891 RepID=A0AAN9SNA4_PSOTE